ncbi:MAG TPA: ClpXP protease specificity-enhancing factor [Thiopseudomonas sp.]|nr:ClpXP protease specificity-enhancing factor [Thiopseudomonas sp.]
MNSSRPYILRALHEWIVDNECTPHLLVDINHPQVKVPPGYAADGQIVLNTAPAAVRYFTVDNEAVSFEALFSGAPFSLYVPMGAILAIYARENGQGMFFDAESDALGEHDEMPEDKADTTLEKPTVLHAVDTHTPTAPDDEPPKPPSPGRPNLRVIK